MPPQTLVPAAVYLRMSTEEQPNSITLQQATIQRYAAAHGFEVIKAYADPGKSGLTFKHRPGLQQLIHDVIGGKAPFGAILVSDISRWGRFQDVDESAHYEFLCRSAGVPIHYCAEQFQNDGTIQSDILKALKRTMAAEYSRELAAKVYAGLRFITSQGFRSGSQPGYGMRRMLLGTDGEPKQVLERYERKNLRTERVTLVPGPDAEVDCVRSIFALAEKQKKPGQISDELNRKGIPYLNGQPWNYDRVWRILKNEKYIGWNVWGKTKHPFGICTKKVPRSLWITKPNAFLPLVSKEQFDRVQALLQGRYKKIRKPDQYYLDELKRIWARKGTLSKELLRTQSRLDERGYYTHFGSLLNAYRLIGFKPSAETLKSAGALRKMHRLRAQLLARLKVLLPARVRLVQCQNHRTACSLELDNGTKVAVHVCALTSHTLLGSPRWRLYVNGPQDNPLSLLCLTNETLDGFRTYYVLPELSSVILGCKTLREEHPLLKGAKRLNSLSELYEAANEVLNEWDSRKDITRAGDAALSTRGAILSISGERISLAPIQTAILKLLMQNADHYVSIKALARCTSTHGRKPVISQIFKIRRRLGHRFWKRIVAMQGKGYMYASIPCCPNKKASGTFN